MRGLVLAYDFNGWATSAHPAGVTKVKGTLVCNDTEPGFGELVDTKAVRLSRDGLCDLQRPRRPAGELYRGARGHRVRHQDRRRSDFEEVIDLWNAFGAVRVIRHPGR